MLKHLFDEKRLDLAILTGSSMEQPLPAYVSIIYFVAVLLYLGECPLILKLMIEEFPTIKMEKEMMEQIEGRIWQEGSALKKFAKKKLKVDVKETKVTFKCS